MEFTQFPFDGSYQALSQDSTSHHGQSTFFNDFQDGIVDMEFNNFGGSSQALDAPGHSSMQRFLKDTQRAPLFNPMPQSQMPAITQPVGHMPFIPSHRRHTTPSSFREPSTCSSVRSPRADTDLYTEHMPPTPPDMAFLPAFQNVSLDVYEQQPSQVFLSGMGQMSGEGYSCVALSEVNPADEVQIDWTETAPVIIDFTSPQRSYTLESEALAPASVEMESINPDRFIDLDRRSAQDPEEPTTTQDNIILVTDRASASETVMASYPTPSTGEREDSEVEIDVAPYESDDDYEDEDEDNDDDDDYDDDYKPVERQAPTSGAWPSSSSSSNKRQAPSAPLQKSAGKRTKTTPTSAPRQSSKPLPPPPSSSSASSSSSSSSSYTCAECSLSFNADPMLQAHVKKQHTRPFICVFRFAGCASTFASKNEWKRHVMSQHLVLHYWLCDLDFCAHNKNTPSSSSPRSSPRSRASNNNSRRRSSSSSNGNNNLLLLDHNTLGPSLPNGAIFNRKDLYTQHLRRMHAPTTTTTTTKKPSSSSSSSSSPAPPPPAWDDELKTHQLRALRERCHLPTRMACPSCAVVFSGADAWDQRMEHVAKHLEASASAAEPPVVFGGPRDPSLMEWATRADVAVVVRSGAGGDGAWVLNNPLRAASEGRGGGRKRDRGGGLAGGAALGAARPVQQREIVVVEEEDGEADAEGEDE